MNNNLTFIDKRKLELYIFNYKKKLAIITIIFYNYNIIGGSDLIISMYK